MVRKINRDTKRKGGTMNHKSHDRKLRSASRLSLNPLPYVLIFTLCTLLSAPFAYSADKLVVKDGGGTSTFKVDENGTISTDVASTGSAVAHAFDSTNSLSLNGDKLFVVKNAGTSILTLNANNASSQGPNLDIATNQLAHMTITAATNTSGWRPVLKGVRARGTLTAKQGILVNDYLFSFLGSGYDSTGAENVTGAFDFLADEDFTGPTNAGTNFQIALRGTGSTVRTTRFFLKSNGNVGLGTTAPTQVLDVNSNGIRIRNSKTPVSSNDACNQGDMAWDANYVYVCISSNLWKRASLGTW